LSSEGAGALSMRRLAAAVGTSTTAVYSLFGGKPALLRALYLEAFGRFGARLAAVEPTGDPIEDLVRLGIAYRESALADPHLYAIMFGRPIPGFEPDDAATAESDATFRPLVDAVRAGIEAGKLRSAPPEVIAIALWANAHGLVSLELNACLPKAMDDTAVSAVYVETLRAAVRGWLPAAV
jgi:AcrR family transcriptional regulator